MSTLSERRAQTDENAVRVVRALMSWHGLTMPDVAAAIGQSIGTIERRLNRDPAKRNSFYGWELVLLADYFGVPLHAFDSGEVDLKSSRLGRQLSASMTSRSSPYVRSDLHELVAA